MYVITLASDRNGRPRNRYFANLEAATQFAGDYFRRFGVVLGIEKK